ncbi:hypothetical protein DFQ28_011126 [Apophysomyces sp. BC1034]|nr:hypothetical protein DFQ30_007398 [Apophysomyces sp. BC1015]KAG0182728.1 hypothetical protein DFQ29_002363 [Apophysomyces sp. BC1021]KAG0191734.1 hypothetical protein DFQ28_011126 [Apophysomyces sp. BC1034]
MSHRPSHFNALRNGVLLISLISIGRAQTISNNPPYNPQLGLVQTNVPWRAGHVAAYIDPYVVVYGGAKNPSTNYNEAIPGSSDMWVWDSRNGSWYQPQVQTQTGADMRPQIFFGATELPSAGQMLAIVGNTTLGGTAGMLQKLDTNSWSWSLPTPMAESPSRAAGFTIVLINNTVYTYGGLGVDANGYPQTNSVLNSLSLLDANSFAWSTGSNGAAVADHTTCYIQSCNCLVTFGGTSTGNPGDATQNVFIYELGRRGWNLQVSVGSTNGAAPGARRLHTSTCLQDKMVVYGGGTTQPFDSDVWVLNAASYPTLTWEKKNMANVGDSPNQRMGHTAVLDPKTKRIYIYGGWGISANNDSAMYVLDTNAWSWTKVATTGYSPSDMPPGSGSSTDPTQPSGISKGAIAGIAVGVIAAAAIIAGALFFILRRRRKQREEAEAERTEKMDEFNDNPFCWRNGGYEEDYASYNGSHDPSRSDANLMTPYGPKRVSKAWTGASSMHNSFNRRSELGDTDRVMTGILSPTSTSAAIDDVMTTQSLSSPRNSARNSKVLLTSEIMHDIRGQGQVPNEIMGQKPNEFSQPAAQFAAHKRNRSVPIEHYTPTGPTSIDMSEATGAPLSSSMEVLRSIQTYGDSTSAGAPRAVAVAHVSVPASRRDTSEQTKHEDDEAWTLADSLSVKGDTPIRYIPPSSKQFSIATTATGSASGATWKNRGDGGGNSIPLTHHQYPSSSMNVPLARTVPQKATSTNRDDHISTTSLQHQEDVNIYDTVSPLGILAALGQTNNLSDSNASDSESGTREDRDSTKELRSSHAHNPIPASSSSTSDNSEETQHSRLLALAPLISTLPRRYEVNMSQTPIVGPTNSVLYVHKVDEKIDAVIKLFKRREAWERECRTLTKLRSPRVVALLEVLTIQDEKNASRSTHDDQSNEQNEEDEENIKYITVMELLEETLASKIRRARRDTTTPWTNDIKRSIARGILECLDWCHSKGIAFCDLKPSNVMQSGSKSWKLIDFEASRTIGEECVGVITPRYCPPEVARATTYGLEGANGVVATSSVDLWALGCVIYELETKQPLFSSNTKDETILHFISHPSPSTPILNNGLRWNDQKELEIPQFQRRIPHVSTQQLILTLLSREPAKRGNASALMDHPYFKTQ